MHKCTTEVSRLKAVTQRVMAGAGHGGGDGQVVWGGGCERKRKMKTVGRGRYSEKERDSNLVFEMPSFPLGQYVW